MYFTDDPLRDFQRHDAEQERQLQMLPKCSECEEPIQDEECYEFAGELICPDCLRMNHRKWTDQVE